MKVFISWSGDLSQSIALILREWLKSVIQIVEPYVSSEDLDKGTRWFAEIDQKLEEAKFSIVCLTRENMSKPWILFEAGAVSRSIDRSRVTPLLIDFSPADLTGPLAQFQATTISQGDFLKLLKSIAAHVDDKRINDTLIEQAFRKWWPDFQQAAAQAIESAKNAESDNQRRPDREILEELLGVTRSIARWVSATPEVQHPSSPLDVVTDFDEIKSGLEKRRKMFLVTALEGASKVYVQGNTFYLEFEPETKHLRDTIEKADNIRILREVAAEVLDREVAFRLVLRNQKGTTHYSQTY